MRVLLTGFGPFGSVVDNPTERLVRRFDGARVGERTVTGLALPTSFSGAFIAIEPHLARHDAVLMLGVAEQSARLRLETLARNHTAARIVDVDGAAPLGPIVDGPSSLPATFDIASIEDAWTRAGVAFERSDSAGAYVCNHTFYRALATNHPRLGFIHVPPDRETTHEPLPHAIELAALVVAIELAISAA